ncbi:MAG: V-type ATP synthase subunit D [bacterium]|nr:V-type ATP synthase subunit D [bacterium]
MKQNIKPTRSELINLKKRIKLAKSGHSLLKKKRDGLILEFFKILKDAKNLRSELVENYKTAMEKMNIVRAVESDLQVKSIAMALKDKPLIELQTKNVMGVVVPEIKGKEITKALFERGYGIISGSSKIDEAALAYEQVVESLVRAAEVETFMKKVLQEIEKTKRKVNALERVTIPNMEEQAAFIRLRLEEMERENFFRLKIIKKAVS